MPLKVQLNLPWVDIFINHASNAVRLTEEVPRTGGWNVVFVSDWHSQKVSNYICYEVCSFAKKTRKLTAMDRYHRYVFRATKRSDLTIKPVRIFSQFTNQILVS